MDKTSAPLGIVAAAVLWGLGCIPGPASTVDAGGSDAGDGGASDAPMTVTYTKDVQPILMAKCSPCHTGQHLGNQDIGTTYADVLKPIESFDFDTCWDDPTMFTIPKKVGECALILIRSGRMPQGAGCGGVMVQDPNACLSADQEATLEAWIAAGMPQ